MVWQVLSRKPLGRRAWYRAQFNSFTHHLVSGDGSLGVVPSAETIQSLHLPAIPNTGGEQHQSENLSTVAPFASILPFLTALPGTADLQEKPDAKPSRYLIEKGLPTIPTRLAEKTWNLEFVEMEELLPAPRSLRLVEHGRQAASLQESLVGAFSQFQAIQHQKSQRRVQDVMTWVRCFTLYVAVMAKKKTDMIPCMVAHLHTVLKLHQKAPQSVAWLEYDIQFRMEMAAREDRVWTGGDPWQYVACLPGPSTAQDPFDLAEQAIPQQQKPSQPPLPPSVPTQQIRETILGKGGRPLDSTAAKAPAGGKPPTKKPKKSGTCRLFNRAPGGCPYGGECVFTHRCSNCGVMDEHGLLACPRLPGPPQGSSMY